MLSSDNISASSASSPVDALSPLNVQSFDYWVDCLSARSIPVKEHINNQGSCESDGHSLLQSKFDELLDCFSTKTSESSDSDNADDRECKTMVNS